VKELAMLIPSGIELRTSNFEFRTSNLEKELLLLSELFHKSFNEVVDLAASVAPAPGGGSVSALVACLGLSMTAMVGNLTEGKKNYQEVQPQIKEIVAGANELMERLKELAERDMKVFGLFMEAFRLPKDTSEEKSLRSETIQKTLREATETPLEIAKVCVSALELTQIIARIGNKAAISDAGVAALALEAAMHGALLNVEVNTALLKDQEYKNQVLREGRSLATNGTRLKAESLELVRARF